MNDGAKERLGKELVELAVKVNRLNDFMRTESFYSLDRVNKDLLYEQYHAMLKYLQILGKRCEVNSIKINIEEK